MNKKYFRWPLIISIILLIFGLFYYRLRTFSIDTDVIGYLPQNDQVLSDARYVIRHLPYQDRVFIDVSTDKPDKDILVKGANFIEDRLQKSGLFKKVGIDDMQNQFPVLIGHIMKNLPVMFDEEELNSKIKPLLSRKNINDALLQNLKTLQNLEGIGQAAYITADPLAFKNIVLGRLADLAPSKKAAIYNGKLLSEDGAHLLIIAELKGSGLNLKTCDDINALLTVISSDIKSFAKKGNTYTLNPVGAYRAVLDNERTTKKDTENAVTISTIVIALLLIVGFPRPLVGLLALVPSIIGTMIAFIVYSLIHKSLSVLAIGFGGAIISFTVDYGITYLLFLDRPYKTYGLKATKEVWSLGLLAMLTTAISFAFLFISGFPALAQIGEFAALGVLFTYICVHAFFPVVFPVMKPAKRKGFVPLKKIVRMIFSGGKYKFFAAILFCAVMLFFAKPDFRIDLASMNSVSGATLDSENLVKKVWGDIFNRIYLLSEGSGIEELQVKGDRLSAMLKDDEKAGAINSAFLPSLIYPGKEKMQSNFNAWKKFWTKARVNELKNNMQISSKKSGFNADAFYEFYSMTAKKDISWTEIPADFYSLFGISNASGKWMQFSVISTGKGYDGEKFYSRYKNADVKIFDPGFFSARLGKMLLSGFIKMAVIVGLISILVAFFYLFDWQLTVISMLPTLFALICTFGTLKILKQPLGIPTIMVTVAVIGMGTDYAIYLVRAFQRYLDKENTSLGLVHMSVFLSFATTFVGFGLLAFSNHTMLKSAGMCLGLGIGYSFLGAACIVPPLLRRVFKQPIFSQKSIVPGSKEHFKAVMARYKHMEAYPRFFARFKIKLDPMFPGLASFVKSPKNILDIGCGYGVPSTWLLAAFPGARTFSLDPDEKRVFIATRAIGKRGTAVTGSAPDLPELSGKFDTALMLDMVHYLSDDDLRLTLKHINTVMSKNGRLIIRVTIPSEKKIPWERWLEYLRVRLLKINAYFRTEAKLKKMLQASGFSIKIIEPSGKKREETWIISEKKGEIGRLSSGAKQIKEQERALLESKKNIKEGKYIKEPVEKHIKRIIRS